MSSEFHPPARLLMGPGPSNVHYRVYQAMTNPVLGYLDPQFLPCLDEIGDLLRRLFQTKNPQTLALQATGGSGMEASFVNFLEPGDTAVIGVKGFFGERMAEVAARHGAEVIRVDQEWGQVIQPERIIQALREHPRAKICALVHAETSTGVLQPLAEIGAFCRNRDTLFLVDAVTSLGACELKVDEWGIDVCYSCSQKGLSVPPGLSPITFSPKAEQALSTRRTQVPSWYFDLSILGKYWSPERAYHHTAPASMLYALREGLRLVFEEGLEARFQRHQALGDYLKAALQEQGFKLFAQEGFRLPMLTSLSLPPGVEDGPVRQRLLQEYNIEVGGGLGKLKGRIWRIGLMGETCRMPNIQLLLGALGRILGRV